jgi:5S rRNA maturation endonuclease (ribonuclease M5)
MSAEAVLARLSGVRRSGGGWVARCPAHDDKDPSLSIHESDGKVLVKCFAGCTTESVCAALSLDLRDLFDERDVAKIAAEYDYTDENGELLFQVVRFEPKAFRQRRPDGRGGWSWNLNGARRVLYRLREVLPAQSVLVVEGEKDAEVARELGLVATCNAGGAGKWREEYSDFLRGKRVAIISDADEPGRKHAQQVARLIHGKAASVRVLELPGAKDLSEWVARGGERVALLDLIRNTPEWKPLPTTGFVLTPLGDLLAGPDVPIEYVWDSRLVAGTVSVVVSKPKVGKSTFARNLCLRLARGEDFLGLKTKRGECIYLALEERGEDVRNDFRAMGADGSEPVYVHAASAPAEGIYALCELVRQRRPALVVVDPLFRLARIKDEKAYAETYTALGPLIDVARETGTHVMLLHHAGKGEKADPIDSPLGSTGIGGAVCSLIVLKRREAYRTIQTVQRIGPEMSETVLEFNAEGRALSLGPEKSDADAQALSEGILEYLRSAGDAKTQSEIESSVEGKTDPKRRALRLLVEQGALVREGAGRRGDPFKYSFSVSCSQHMSGTREQETEKVAQTRINTGDILVPDFGQDSFLVPATEGSEKQVEEGEL